MKKWTNMTFYSLHNAPIVYNFMITFYYNLIITFYITTSKYDYILLQLHDYILLQLQLITFYYNSMITFYYNFMITFYYNLHEYILQPFDYITCNASDLPGSELGNSQVPTKFPQGFVWARVIFDNKCPLSFASTRVNPLGASGPW